MKLTKLQKKIIFSIFGFILGERAVRYTYLKNITEITMNGNYFELTSMFNIFVFILGLIVFVFSIFGLINIVFDILKARKSEVVSERFIKLFVNSFLTALISWFLALLVKILIWP